MDDELEAIFEEASNLEIKSIEEIKLISKKRKKRADRTYWVMAAMWCVIGNIILNVWWITFIGVFVTYWIFHLQKMVIERNEIIDIIYYSNLENIERVRQVLDGVHDPNKYK